MKQNLILEKFSKEGKGIDPSLMLSGLCRATGCKPDQLSFGKARDGKTLCLRGITMGVCRGNRRCNFFHTYVPSDEEARAVDTLLRPGLKVLRDKCHPVKKRKGGNDS